MNALALLFLAVPTQDAAFDADAAADAVIADLGTKLDNPKKPMRLLVTFEVKADKEEEFVELFRMATKKTRTEEGNITYMMSKVAGQTDYPTYVLFETWKSLDALDDHMHTDYLATVLETLPELTESVDMKVMTLQLAKEHRRNAE